MKYGLGTFILAMASMKVPRPQSSGVRFYGLAAITILFIDGSPMCVAATQVEHLGKILVKSCKILARSSKEKN